MPNVARRDLCAGGCPVMGIPTATYRRECSASSPQRQPTPAAPAGGYEPCPIDPDYDRYYVQDEAESLVHV